MSPSTVLPAEGPACSTVVQCVVTLVEVQPLDRMLRAIKVTHVMAVVPV